MRASASGTKYEQKKVGFIIMFEQQGGASAVQGFAKQTSRRT